MNPSPPEKEQQIQTLKKHLGLLQFVGESAVLLAAIRRIPEIAAAEVSVLLRGETGTGKEICARAIHYLSPRIKAPFVPVNCGALPVDLVENELFGHAPGAFTSANTASPGLIEQANGGTIFLDEIDSLPLSAQVKMLRFLQDKQYRPLGSEKACTANLSVIAATNINLEEALSSGRFRQDLYYRLSVVKLTMPPLRDRIGDVELLARHFLIEYAAKYQRLAEGFSAKAMQRLVLYRWPGNVRELENVIADAVLRSQEHTIQAEQIALPSAPPVCALATFSSLKAQMVRSFEANYVADMLRRHDGNISRAARAAGLNRRTFFGLLRKHGQSTAHRQQ